MKLHEAVFDALSDIDEKMLEHSEQPKRGFALRWTQAAGLLALVFCLIIIPHLHGFGGMGAMNSDAKDMEYAEAVENSISESTNIVLTGELQQMLEEGKTVMVQITVTQNAESAYEDLQNILEDAGISAEITADGIVAKMNQEDFDKVAWPEEYAMVFRAVKEEK